MTDGGVTVTIVDDEDQQASQPKPFSDEEKAWGAILHTTGKYFTSHAAKYPPRNENMYQFALALGLIPNASGALFADRRAKRLLLLIDAMQPPERAIYATLARERLSTWLTTNPPLHEKAREEPESHMEMTQPDTLPEPGVVRPWRLPDDQVLPSLHEEGAQALELQEARLREEVGQGAQRLQATLDSFGVKVEVRPEDISIGPTVYRYGLRPTGIPEMQQDGAKRVPLRDGGGQVVYRARTKVTSILQRENDIALWLEAAAIRMQAPVPGRPYVGVEIPRKERRIVHFDEIIAQREYKEAVRRSRYSVALGLDVTNRLLVVNIRKWPHLLIGGTTGAGKSVLLKCLLTGILKNCTPDDVRLALVDPKWVELGMFEGIPHLLSPVVTDMSLVVPLLDNAVQEMEKRYRLFSSLGVTDLESYIRLRQERRIRSDTSLKNLPVILIVIDELADLMDQAPEETEKLIKRLSQKARATGIHLILATQRPSVDVITGVIKANIPTRISFMVSSTIDSRTILGMGGAERLVGRGDLLYQAEDSRDPIRIQGGYIEDEAVKALVQYWKEEKARHANGTADDPLQTEGMVQLALDTSWNLQPDGSEKAVSRTKAKESGISAQQLEDYLTSYLLHGQILVDGTPLPDTPIPVPLRSLEREDQALIAEAVTWRGHRGSAETLNRKLRTKQGAELRDILINRGLMDPTTQQPIRPSDRLAPLLIECGIIQDAAEESVEIDVTEELQEEPSLSSAELSTP